MLLAIRHFDFRLSNDSPQSSCPTYNMAPATVKPTIASAYQLVDFGTFVLTSQQRTGDMVYDALLKMDAQLNNNDEVNRIISCG